jgi:hypothetical protein
MSSLSKANVALFVPLPSKPSKLTATSDFLLAGHGIVTKSEPLTLHWFALQSSTNSEQYFIFDTFAADEGRDAHLTGDVAKALGANAEELLAPPGPAIHKVDILASKVLAGDKSLTEGLAVGLVVEIIPQEGKTEAVRNFLIVSVIWIS